jgi:hypothetical protein
MVAMRSPETARRFGWHGRAHDPSVFVGGNAGPLQRSIEGYPGPDQKRDEVVAPKFVQVAPVFLPHAVDKDGILRAIGSQVGRGASLPESASGVGHFQHRTGALIALAIQEEVEGEFLGHDGKIALHEARREPAACAGNSARANLTADALTLQHGLRTHTGSISTS